jgi:hypothetical protein
MLGPSLDSSSKTPRLKKPAARNDHLKETDTLVTDGTSAVLPMSSKPVKITSDANF